MTFPADAIDFSFFGAEPTGSTHYLNCCFVSSIKWEPMSRSWWQIVQQISRIPIESSQTLLQNFYWLMEQSFPKLDNTQDVYCTNSYEQTTLENKYRLVIRINMTCSHAGNINFRWLECHLFVKPKTFHLPCIFLFTKRIYIYRMYLVYKMYTVLVQLVLRL